MLVCCERNADDIESELSCDVVVCRLRLPGQHRVQPATVRSAGEDESTPEEGETLLTDDLLVVVFQCNFLSF